TTVLFAVTFSRAVTGLTPSNFALATAGGGSGAAISSVYAGANNTWHVNVNTGTGYNTIGLNLVDSTGVTDINGNALSNVPPTFVGQTYTIDQTAPAVASIGRTSANPTNASSVGFRVIFSRAVTGLTAGNFGLATTGGGSGATITSVTGSGIVRTVTVS